MNQEKISLKADEVYLTVFSEMRRLWYLVLYILLSFSTGYLLFLLIYEKKMITGILTMIQSSKNFTIENIILLLLLLSIFAFAKLFYNSISILTLCVRIDSRKCYIKSIGGTMIFSIPVLDHRWRVLYKKDIIVLSADKIQHVKCYEEHPDHALIPDRRISIEFENKRTINADMMFFEGKLSDIKDRIESVVFPELFDELFPVKIRYRDGVSIIDESGNFIPPVNSDF